MEQDGLGARILINPCLWSFLAHRSGPFLVGPSLSVPQLELPASSDEVPRRGARGALGYPRASISFDHQSWPSHPHPCCLPRDGFPPAQAQVLLPSKGGGSIGKTGRTVDQWKEGKKGIESNIDGMFQIGETMQDSSREARLI